MILKAKSYIRLFIGYFVNCTSISKLHEITLYHIHTKLHSNIGPLFVAEQVFIMTRDIINHRPKKEVCMQKMYGKEYK